MELELSSLSELKAGQVLIKVLPNTTRNEVVKALKNPDDLYSVESVNDEAIVLKVAKFDNRKSTIQYELISIKPRDFFFNCCWYIR